MAAGERDGWCDLLQGFHHGTHIEPPRDFLASLAPRLARLTTMAFHIRFFWCAAVAGEPALDAALMTLTETRWQDPAPIDKGAGALAYLWTTRPPAEARAPLEQLARKFGYPGGKIEGYFRRVRAV